jgi:hypothetical protein
MCAMRLRSRAHVVCVLVSAVPRAALVAVASAAAAAVGVVALAVAKLLRRLPDALWPIAPLQAGVVAPLHAPQPCGVVMSHGPFRTRLGSEYRWMGISQPTWTVAVNVMA